MIIAIRMVSALLASFVICFTMAWIQTVPESEQVENIYYASFLDHFLFPFVFTSFIFIVIATPYSLLVDSKLQYLRKKRLMKEVLASIYYAVGGAIAMLLLFIIIQRSVHIAYTKELIFVGAMSALLYYLIIRCLEYVWSRAKR